MKTFDHGQDMTSVNPEQKSRPVLRDKSIRVIGPRRLQNELMALFLHRETGARCTGVEDPSRLSAKDIREIRDSGLILLDCLDRNAEGFPGALESDLEKTLRGCRVALFNIRAGQGIEEKGLGHGVKGFFYEQDPPERFPRGVRAIFDGELWASREIMAKYIAKDPRRDSMPKEKDPSLLSPREIEILVMLATGARNGDIAKGLFISPNTVKTHVYNIFKKIGVPNRLQAALWAAKNLPGLMQRY